jgi:MFS family permease
MIAMAQVGLRAVAQDRTLQTLLISQAGLFLVSPFLILALPFLLIDELGMSESALGLYLALALAGGIVGFLVLRKVTQPFLLTKSLHGYSYLALGAAFAAVGLAPHPVVLGVAAVVSGVAAATVYLVTVTWIQVRSRPQLHGRLFAVLEAGNSAFAPVGYLVAGILLELLGANHRMVLLVAVASAALAWGVAMLWYNKMNRYSIG